MGIYVCSFLTVPVLVATPFVVLNVLSCVKVGGLK